MKKILFVAFAATLLAAGCQKTEVINQDGPSSGSLMSFSTEMSKLTKSTGEGDRADADEAGMYNLRSQEFRVWAYCDYDDPNVAGDERDLIYDGMENLNIYYDKPADHEDKDLDKGTWKPAKEYYWPSAGKALRFFAVSGADLGEDLSEPTNVEILMNRTSTGETTTVAPTLTISDYTIDNSDPNTDLMVADFLCYDKSAATEKTVKFNFRHALSKVQFMFKTEGTDADVYVQSLIVEDVKTKATLTVSGEHNFLWSGHDVAEDFTDDYDDTNEELSQITIEKLNSTSNNDFTALKLTSDAEEFATWLVLPQDIVTKDETSATITDGYKVEVIYVIGTRQFKATFPLYVKNTLEKWDVNQYTKYLVTITPNKITFNATAEEWTPYEDGDIDMAN